MQTKLVNFNQPIGLSVANANKGQVKDNPPLLVTKISNDSGRMADVKKQGALLAKVKASKLGLSESNKQEMHSRSQAAKAETARYDAIFAACEKTFGGWDNKMIAGGLTQHFLSFSAAQLDKAFTQIAGQSSKQAEAIKLAEKPIRQELVNWLFAGNVAKPLETWAQQANKSHLENGLRNAVDSLPSLPKASMAERKQQRETDYQSLTHVTNKLLDEFNRQSTTPVRTLDGKVLSSVTVMNKLDDLLAQHLGVH